MNLEIKNTDAGGLTRLAAEIRRFLVETVSKTGGHLASNLGVVELTLALFKVFDFPRDKVVWDVGHQAYVHKILSGRAGMFRGLRATGGLSGFPKRAESPYDSFNTGHSSTSISAALGFARARDSRGDNYKVIAVTGDGALTGGMCYEALNDAGNSANDLIVILNDNEMSISDNVGGVSKYLSKIRSLPAYISLRDDIHTSLKKLPVLGRPMASVISRFKSVVKYAIIPGVLFEEMGFRYIGPVDGHDIESLIKILAGVSKMRGPVLVHVATKKGMGYPQAETDPQKYHGVAPDRPAGVSMSAAFGQKLAQLARQDSEITVITAAMKAGTGADVFAKMFPGRFFDVGIAEQHALTLAAAMSMDGLKPVVAIYSTFLQRAYDQILHDICLQNAHVVIAVDRAGIVGPDGETHQGIYDIAFLRHMPNITILAPAYDYELEQMLTYAIYDANGPVVIRYPKDTAPHTRQTSDMAMGAHTKVERGKGALIKEGRDVTIVSVGALLPNAAEAAESLGELGFYAELISARFVKPFDEHLIFESVKKTGRLIVVEEGCAAGGFGSSVVEFLVKKDVVFRARLCGLPDEVIPQGARTEQLCGFGLSAGGIVGAALELLTCG